MKTAQPVIPMLSVWYNDHLRPKRS